MPAVTWRRLTLAGFGCYRDEVTIYFRDGLNVLVAPNERGKSTLVAGLEAVLFGLPGSSNPEAFGSARFFNREEPPRFAGEVEFLVDGRVFIVRRQFNNNRVSISTGDDHSREEVWRGSHNPAAHRINPVYNEYLASFVGMTSRELFEATFCLGQPLPEGKSLAGEVQKLLSGSGGHYQEALQVLADDLRALTRYCGDLGVGNNGRKDARLEELQAEIAALKDQQQQTGVTIDRLTAVAARLREAGAALRDTERELQRQRQLLAAWERWRALQVRYGSALREQQKLEGDREAARELDGRIRHYREEAARLYPEWAAAGRESAAALERLARLEQELERYRSELNACSGQMRQLQQERRELEERLAGELQAAAAHPDVLHDLEDLKNLLDSRDELLARLRELEEREAAAAAGLAALPDYGRLGASPVTALEGLQVAARQLVENWERFREQQRRSRELEEELTGEWRCFLDLPPGWETRVADYAATRLSLEKTVEAARNDVRRIEEQKENYRRRQEEFARDYGDLEGLGEEALAAAAVKPRLLDELQAAEAARQALREAALGRKRKASAIFAAAAGILAGLVTALLGGEWFHTLAAALLLAAAGYGAGCYLARGNRELAGPDAALEGIKQELVKVDACLGAYARATAVELGELRQRLLARQRAQAELAALATALPDGTAEAAAQEALAAAERAYRDFQEATAGLRARFHDVGTAYRRYQEARREKERLEAEMAAFTTRALREPPATALEVPLASLSTPWPELACLARLAGREPVTAGELLAWLQECDDSCWNTFREQARRWEELGAAFRQARDRREQLLQPDGEGRTAGERLEAQIAALREHIAPFTPDDDHREIARLLAAAREARERLLDCNGRLQTISRQEASLQEQIAALNTAAENLRRELAAVLAPAGGETGTARQRRQAYEEMARQWQAWQEQLAGLLRGGSLQDLVAACLDAANRTLAVLQEWQALCREHPGLPEPGSNMEVAALDEQYRALRASIDGLAGRQAELENEERELLRQQSRLEGSQVVNIAAVTETIAIREKERQRLEQEAAALALAYRELVAAVQEYSHNYRRELAQAASRYFALFTGREERQVDISADFCVEVKERGAGIALAQLSRGAQDQLYLALRLAIGDILAADLTLPFIFDDCFINCDRERRERIRASLLALAPQRQMILLSHDPDFAAWGTPVHIEGQESNYAL